MSEPSAEERVKTLEQSLEEVESDLFENFFEEIKQSMEGGSSAVVPVPDDYVSARKWVYSYVRMSKQIERWKKEYIPYLQGLYIKPVLDKIEDFEKSQGVVKDGLLEFLKEAEEKNASFPDVASICITKTQAKIIYPDDDKDLIKRLDEENSEYIKREPKLDKKKILEEFKKTHEVPIEELMGQDPKETVRITPVKGKNNVKV